MNQGKLEVVKQEMARVNIDILGISELKWTGMGEFNSDDHYIYYYGQEFLRRNGVAIMVNKRSEIHYLDAISKTNRDHSVIFETASKYCISDSFVDYDGYSISSKEFLPTVVYIIVIRVNSPFPVHFSLLIPMANSY